MAHNLLTVWVAKLKFGIGYVYKMKNINCEAKQNQFTKTYSRPITECSDLVFYLIIKKIPKAALCPEHTILEVNIFKLS